MCIESANLTATKSAVLSKIESNSHADPEVFRDLEYYPVIMLPKKQADQMRLHIQNKLSGLFGPQHMAKAVGAPSKDGVFVFALTWSALKFRTLLSRWACSSRAPCPSWMWAPPVGF